MPEPPIFSIPDQTYENQAPVVEDMTIDINEDESVDITLTGTNIEYSHVYPYYYEDNIYGDTD